MELLTPETSLGYAAAFISNSKFLLSNDKNFSSFIFLVFFFLLVDIWLVLSVGINTGSCFIY